MQSASEDVSGAFLLLPEETVGNDAIFQQLPNTSGNKRLNRKHFNNSTKNSNLFSSKMPLDMLYGGGGKLEEQTVPFGVGACKITNEKGKRT